jgi:hypothetical protein
MSSQLISYPLRLHDCCPQSEGACALIYANQDEYKKHTDNPAWFKSVSTAHYYTFGTDDIMYDLPSKSGVSECVIGDEVVLNNEPPLLLYENQKKYA